MTIDRLAKATTGKFNLIVYKPDAYDGTKLFPLIVFLPGINGKGDDMAALEREVPPELKAAVNAEGGFIVVAVQTPTTYDAEIPFAHDYVVKNYKVDTTRKYLTGLSYGGGGTFFGVSKYPTLFHAAAPIATTWTTFDGKAVANNKVAVWAFHNINDTNGGTPVGATKGMVDQINLAGADPKAVYTLFNTSGHGGWGTAYTHTVPPYAPGGQGLTNPTKTLYQWLLMNNATTRVEPPAASSGTGLAPILNITEKDGLVTLDGRGSSGYLSAKLAVVSVPAGENIWNYNVQGGGTETGSIQLTKAGSYTFRLTVYPLAGYKGTPAFKDMTYQFGGAEPPVKKPTDFDPVTKTLFFSDGSQEYYTSAKTNIATKLTTYVTEGGVTYTV
jgi:hypothetical protein